MKKDREKCEENISVCVKALDYGEWSGQQCLDVNCFLDFTCVCVLSFLVSSLNSCFLVCACARERVRVM